MASHILKFYKFAKKIPQIQKKNCSGCMTPSVASLCNKGKTKKIEMLTRYYGEKNMAWHHAALDVQ